MAGLGSRVGSCWRVRSNASPSPGGRKTAETGNEKARCNVGFLYTKSFLFLLFRNSTAFFRAEIKSFGRGRSKNLFWTPLVTVQTFNVFLVSAPTLTLVLLFLR